MQNGNVTTYMHDVETKPKISLLPLSLHMLSKLKLSVAGTQSLLGEYVQCSYYLLLSGLTLPLAVDFYTSSVNSLS